MDNTIVRDLFAKDINRSINGVVKVQDSKDESIRQELDEYVVTRELQGHFATFFKAYGRCHRCSHRQDRRVDQRLLRFR